MAYMGRGQDVWRFLACFVVTFSSFASWSVPRSIPDQIDHIYISQQWPNRTADSPNLSSYYSLKTLLKLVAMNALKILCWDAKKSKNISLSVFSFSVGFQDLLFFTGHLWEVRRWLRSLSPKDGYGGSSNAFRSRSSGTRMECACRISDPKIFMPKPWKKSWEYCRALVLLSCQYAHFCWCVHSFWSKKRYMICWYCMIYDDVSRLYTDGGISSAWQGVVKVLLST